MVKSKLTNFFQQNTAETNDRVVEPVCHADPGGIEFWIACDECSDKQQRP